MSTLYVGLMSGTSMDGVDAALCEFDGRVFKTVIASAAVAYAPSLRQRLLALQRDAAPTPLSHVAELDTLVADTFAHATCDLLAQAGLPASQIAAIGSHGQTVFHDPLGVRSSWQLGDPSRIAVSTGITTVADFRRKDIALGGHGAPLVPAFHQALFGSAAESRGVLNIGGIANLTLLPSDGAPVRGFDTGPGNGLMDEWVQQHLGDAYDADGVFASGGRLHEGLLAALLADPYFSLAPPKSTGRGQFHLDWMESRFPALATISPADVQHTLTELTARSAVNALHAHAPGARRLLVCGGGVRNGFLMQRLRALAGVPVESTSLYGLEAQAVEAAAFAWLAMRTLLRLPGNLPTVTGASREAVLGGVFHP